MSNFNWCRDGILGSILISTLEQPLLRECMNLVSNYSQIREKIPINNTLQDSIMEKLYEEFKSDSTEIITTDGIKIILDNTSWILIRFSNTEHVLRISLESIPSRVKIVYKNTLNRVKRIYDQNK
jgi:phosphomannomutase